MNTGVVLACHELAIKKYTIPSAALRNTTLTSLSQTLHE